MSIYHDLPPAPLVPHMLSSSHLHFFYLHITQVSSVLTVVISVHCSLYFKGSWGALGESQGGQYVREWGMITPCVNLSHHFSIQIHL